MDGITPNLNRIASAMRHKRPLMAACGKRLEVDLRNRFSVRELGPEPHAGLAAARCAAYNGTMKWRAIVMGLVLLDSAAASADPAIATRTAVAETRRPVPALQPNVTRVYSRSDGGLSMRMADGSTAYAWPTSRGYTVTFPGGQAGSQIWTRTVRGWSVTQLPSAQDPNSAATLRTERRPSARNVRRIEKRSVAR